MMALLATLGIVVSGTRGTWLAVVVVVLLMVLPQLSPRRRLAAVALSAAVGIAVLQVPGVAALVTERTDTAVSTGGAGRTDIWSVAVTIYGTAPVLGVGFANFPVAYTPELVRASDVGSGEVLAGRAPHTSPRTRGTRADRLLLLACSWSARRSTWARDQTPGSCRRRLLRCSPPALLPDVLANPNKCGLVNGISAG